MEITIDKKGRSLLIYSQDDIDKTKKILSNIPDIQKLEFLSLRRNEERTVTNYFNFKLGKQKFKVRISDHTKKSAPNEFLSGCYFDFGRWIIDVGIGRYKPSEIVDIINHIQIETDKYTSKNQSKSIDKYIEAHFFENYNDEWNADDVSETFARGFLSEMKIQDNKYCTNYNVLKKIFLDKLNH